MQNNYKLHKNTSLYYCIFTLFITFDKSKDLIKIKLLK